MAEKKIISVEAAKQNLINAILASEVYMEYRKQLEIINQDPDLKRQIDDYRSQNYQMQMNSDLDFGQLTRFYEQFKGFRENPKVDTFLAAELDLCRMMQGINFDITEALDFE